MQTRLGFSSARSLTNSLLLAGATLLMAYGCGGSGSSGSGGNGAASGASPSAGTAAGGDAGETSNGEAGKASGGKGGAGKGGASGTTTGSAGEAGEQNNNGGDGGEAGAIDLPPAKNSSAVSFVSSGAISKSKNFTLISATGESLGGTVGSKRSRSLKHTYIPGVIAASSN